jgi:hypothetical protein
MVRGPSQKLFLGARNEVGTKRNRPFYVVEGRIFAVGDASNHLAFNIQ